jgi:hypothetical protein
MFQRHDRTSPERNIVFFASPQYMACTQISDVAGFLDARVKKSPWLPLPEVTNFKKI